MADKAKFEEMLEHLVNNDREKAEELFHEIVVEKSRDIYENLLADDVEDKEVDEKAKEDDEETNEASKDKKKMPKDGEDKVADADADKDSEKTNEDFDLDEFEVEGDDPMDAMMGGDAADDMEMDMGDKGMDMDMDMDMDSEEDDDAPATQGDIKDLEAELEDLKAEFEDLMQDKEGGDDEGEEGEMDMNMDDEGDDAEEESVAYEGSDEEVDEEDDEATEKSAAEQMREYVEKVTPKMGDNGANTKSVVAGKNDMGGTASNLVQGGDEKGMKASAPKEDSAGNVNVPGGKASKSMSNMPKGHGAEKKGQGDAAPDKKSMIGS